MPDLRISQLLPTVKCSSCGLSVPLDRLVDHVCPPVPTSSASSSRPSPPRLKLQTAIANATAGATSPRLPSTSPRDTRNYDRAPPRTNPSRAPSRNGVRSPAQPPSRTQTPILPPSSTRQPTSQYNRPQPQVALNAIPGNSHPSNIHAHPSVANHHRPSVPPSPLAQAPRAAYDPRLMPMSSRPTPPIRVPPSPAPSNYSSHHHFMGPEIDTKSGGAAGMAGVGRRGFAAAARAAMFAASAPPTPTSPPPAFWNSAPSSPPPMDGRRAYPPPNVQNPSAAAPHMPYPYSPPAPLNSPPLRSQDPRSSQNARPSIPPTPSTPPLGSPPGRDNDVAAKSSSIPFPLRPSHTSKPSKASGPLTPTSPTGLPFSSPENLSQKKRVVSGDTVKVVTQDDTNSSFHMRDDEGSEFGGLAYAQSDESDDDGIIERRMSSTPTRVHRRPSIASSAYSDDRPRAEQMPMEDGFDMAIAALLGSPASTDKALSPAPVNKVLSPTSPTVSIPRASKPPMRSLTSPLTSPTQRDSSILGGVINRRGGTISGAIGGGSSDKSRRKERLSEESSASGLGKYRETVFTCMRCSKEIEDNRWIQVENGKGVLCGKCWKNMYLPKCRRCNMPIEKQAVSSSDGQLKGKYHRDCFNCHTCHKPFPDRTFYVFDGKPFCDYHYHEANNSLCAAPDCGRPIEGPCAVSHSGDRYHPEHLTCEYEEDDGTGARCDERLVDYWEVEGRMLCERHMRRVVEQDMMGDEPDDVSRKADARAMRRKTRFIDIAGLR
ncbi:hypothetical protein EDB83DRAFT_2513889 [Lactarius deliciosus]|nr:hypothetical protein EDB83DRAFT_2513889 [Lactarius deliciosus]